jgi:hypothetical protein
MLRAWAAAADGDAQFLGDPAGGVGNHIIDTDELDFAGGREFGVDAGVFLAQRAGAEDGDADFVRGLWFELCAGHGREIASKGDRLTTGN